MLPIILCLLLLGGIAVPAPAEIFKYIDKNGGVHYTNDPTQVPEDQLTGAERNAVPEIKSPPAAVPAPQSSPEEKIKKTKETTKAPQKPEMDFSLKKQDLEKKYKALMTEKEQIEKDTATYTKRYKTRKRKGVSRKKLKELKLQNAEWEKKFIDYQAHKKALELLTEKAAKE
jgi:hypothetical protein